MRKWKWVDYASLILSKLKRDPPRDPANLIVTAQGKINHDDAFKWKHFPRYWPFVRRIHRSPVNSPHKGQWRGALMFTLFCARINGWVNNSEASDLRRHRGHYDVTVMQSKSLAGAHFTDDFSIVIQIQWKLHSVIVPLRLLKNIKYGTIGRLYVKFLFVTSILYREFQALQLIALAVFGVID